MDFAAEAMLDLQPPPRAAGKPARAESDGESFASYLDATAGERAEDAPLPRASKKAPTEEPEPSDQAASSLLVVAPPEPPPAAITLALVTAPAGPPAAPITPEAPAEVLPGALVPPPPDTAESLNAPFKADTSTKAATETKPEGVIASDNAQQPALDQKPVEAEARPQPPATTQPHSTPLPLALVSLVAQQNTPPAPAQTSKIQTPRIDADAPSGAEASTNAPDAPAKSAEPAPNAFKAALNTAQSGAEQPRPAPPLLIERAEANTASPQSGLMQATALQSAAPMEHIASAHAMARAVPAMHQVAQEIIRRFDGDTTQFDLRLDPPELGRVEVRLEVSRDHRVTAVVAADNPQALAELARHARDLEQMLQSAGLQLSDKGLSFDLRQGHERAADARNDDAAGEQGGQTNAEDNAATSAISARPVGFERWRGVRVDISV